MECPADIFSITLGIPDPVAKVHHIDADIYKLVFVSPKPTVLELKILYSKHEQQIYMLRISAGTSLICLCGFKRRVYIKKDKIKISVSTIDTASKDFARHYNVNVDTFSTDTKLVKHTATIGENCTLFSVQFVQPPQYEFDVKKKYQPESIPTDIVLKYIDDKLHFSNIVFEVKLTSHQEFLLRLAPDSIYCSAMYCDVGHGTTLTQDNEIIELSPYNHKYIQTYMPTHTYKRLFESDDSPRIHIKSPPKRHVDIFYSDDSDRSSMSNSLTRAIQAAEEAREFDMRIDDMYNDQDTEYESDDDWDRVGYYY